KEAPHVRCTCHDVRRACRDGRRSRAGARRAAPGPGNPLDHQALPALRPGGSHDPPPSRSPCPRRPVVMTPDAARSAPRGPGLRRGVRCLGCLKASAGTRCTARANPWSTVECMDRALRVNVTLDPEHDAKLTQLAARTHLERGTLARSLLLQAIDDADPGPRN